MANVRILAIITLISLMLSGCDNEPGLAESVESVAFNDLPLADFNYEFRGDCSTPILEVRFENGSKNSDSYEWVFGDGTTSQETNPTKIYAKAGTYTVTLKATREGETNQSQKEIYIIRNSDGTGPKVTLSYERGNSTSLQIVYLISAGGIQYLLSFGDGETLISNGTKITHTYSGRARYTAIVTVENEGGLYCASVEVDP
jgi:PKD repeat protein